MSTIRNTANHLKEVAHPTNRSNSRYNIAASSSRLNAVRGGGDMGGMVSAITAVFCGTGRHAEDDSKAPEENRYHILNGDTHSIGRLNTNGHSNDIEEEFTALDNSLSCDSSYKTPEGFVSEFVDKFDRSTEHQRLDIPYMDESSASSSCVSSPREVKDSQRNTVDNQQIIDGDHRHGYTEEVIEISETEYSADEEQEVESDEYEVDEVERANSDTEEEEFEDEHICDSDCEHSEEEVEHESEVESGREDIQDSDCEYLEEESSEESEYESEVEQSGSEDDEEVIEISENEVSCDEEQESDNEGKIINCECDSNCESDCDGNHHECSSECGCDQHQSESDEENNDKLQVVDKPPCESLTPQLNGINHHPPLPLPRHSLNRASSLSFNDESKTSPNSLERNNNRLQRNHSQRIPQRSTEDMLGELKTAIDARVKRSASCRETAIDYRKRYAHLSSNESSIAENFSKLDVKDRELRRKERRTRLRTLELKREQCLDEVRDGTEENVTDRVYREACL